MIKDHILLVEDDEVILHTTAEWLREVVDGHTVVHTGRSYAEAMKHVSQRNLTYCIVDLGLPAETYGRAVEVGPGEACELGFRLIDDILRLNPFAEVVIASRFSDHQAVQQVKNRVVLQPGARVRRVLNKTLDENYLDRIEEDIKGLDGQIGEILKRLGVRAVHPLERRIVRRLWALAKRPVTGWPTPRVVIRGESRSGKDTWADVFSEFVDVLRPHPDRPDTQRVDIGTLPVDGEGARVALFGMRKFDRQQAAGIFEKATFYRRQNRQHFRPGHDLATPRDRPVYEAGAVAILREIGNLRIELQPLLLSALDTSPLHGGIIQTAGEPISIRVGCSFVFTTNAAIEERVVSSERAGPGEFREDLYRRLRAEPSEWLYVPSIHDLGMDGLLAHLRARLRMSGGEEPEIAPSAIALLQTALDRKLPELTMEAVDGIANNYRPGDDLRIVDDHIIRALAKMEQPSRTIVSPSRARPRRASPPNLPELAAQTGIKRNTKQYFALKYFVERFGSPVNEMDLLTYLNETPEAAAVRGPRYKPYDPSDMHPLVKLISDLKTKLAAHVAATGVELQPRLRGEYQLVWHIPRSSGTEVDGS